jgi:phosphatidylserine/phosphatidylglycerophosphate/cardiolipin synthase-like enzyme
MNLLPVCRGLLTLHVLVVLLTAAGTSLAADSYPAQVSVYFSPHGGCTAAIVRELGAAHTQVLLQAYSFTSAPIAKALTEAKKRGVKVLAVLDKSNQTDKYSAATFLEHAGIPTVIDDQHAIAHSKVLVIDSSMVMTGSFNFTTAAEEQNAENLLLITDAPALAKAYEANILAHATHSHPYHRTTAGSPHSGAGEQLGASSRETPVGQGMNGGFIHANRQSKVYHLPSCPGYERVSAAHMVPFATEAEARKAGYRKAKHCP